MVQGCKRDHLGRDCSDLGEGDDLSHRLEGEREWVPGHCLEVEPSGCGIGLGTRNDVRGRSSQK